MNYKLTQGAIAVNIEKLALMVNIFLPILAICSFVIYYQFFSHIGFVLSGSFFSVLTIINFYYRHIQKRHTLLSNFGITAQLRYIIESLGPEFRQYLFMSDVEEKPFNRLERAEVYKLAKGENSTASFGSKHDFDADEIKLKHSMFPVSKDSLEPFELIFGEERGVKRPYTMNSPIMSSAMSYGSLGKRAVEALSTGAKRAGILMNTGEGGFPKYHLKGGADLIFQLGTAKFGARNKDASLHEENLKKICELDQVKMLELKFSQGAKPGKGGLLPKEKITEEIAELRGVERGADVISPSSHVECIDYKSTVEFIKRVQSLVDIPVGIKLCFGQESEFRFLVQEMKTQDVFPDYITIDGAEGGTGAAPKSFLDDVGVPIFKSLPLVHSILKELDVRHKTKLLAAGKLINPGKQFMALSLGADAIYTARGFMLALGCIQALQCNQNSCPVGLTTHHAHLENGIDIDDKANRVKNYVDGLVHEHQELLAALGKKNYNQLSADNLYVHKN